MPLEQKKYDVVANNDWAKNVKGEHIFIDNAESGRKGYFCIGCDKQMEAVKKKNLKHRSFFRHVPVDVDKDETPCTFSNREYRETLATDILQRLKSIKVPNVYKFPSKVEGGLPMLLEKAKFVIAKKVKSQLTFYEDKDGAVKYGKNPEVEDRFLLIRPDVTFFDANDKPILLIELVITHKVKEEKKIKLRRLGIDTVSVIVPKSSAQDIEDNFKTTKRIKWEYNEIEANTEYIRVSSGVTEGVLEFDEDQRRIFEETLKCRKARLSNTIRTIKKCLRTESYKRAERDFESEISRIEGATKREREGLEEMERRIENEVNGELSGERQRIEFEEGEFRKLVDGLEERYYKKTAEIRTEQIQTEKSIEERYNIGRLGDEVRERFRIEEERLEREFESDKRAIEYGFSRKKENIDWDIEDQRREVEGLESDEKKEQRSFEREKSRIIESRERIQEKINRLGLEFESLRKRSLKAVNERDCSGDSELSKRIKAVLDVGRISSNYDERLKTYKRYKSYLGIARRGTWKK